MNRTIRKVAVLGSGIMGSRIACHFANIGVEVLLLDIAPKELTEEEKKKGLTLDSPLVKNRIVQSSFDSTLKANPAPLYHKRFTSRIRLGNFTDDMAKIKDFDWTIEVVVENLDIKKKVYDEVEKHSKTWNTHHFQYVWYSHSPDGRRKKRRLSEIFLRNTLLQPAALP
jgi:3-hydroxyacyl-CoA dehydrogenase